MKILTIVYNLDKGGTQRAAQNFCEGYAKLGNDSRILAVYKGGIRAEELINERIKVWIGFNEKILDEIANWTPDIIHIHSHGINKQIMYKVQRFLPKAKYVETNVFSIPSDYMSMLTYSYQLSHWCQYLYCSRGGPRNTSIIIPYPIKTMNFYRSTKGEINNFKKKYGIPQEDFIFGRIGQHYYGKWSVYLIDLFKKFIKNTNSKSCLLLVNPPKEIIECINNKNLGKKVIVIDKITNDNELRQCYSTMDIFLHIANQGESFGMVLAESLLCETPIITLNTPWGDNSQYEVVGKGGICVNTIHDFYKEMIKLYNNKSLRDKLGENGREYIINKYDYLLVAKDSINVMNNVDLNKNDEISFYKMYHPCLFVNKLISLLLWIKFNVRYSHKYINYILRKLLKFNYMKGIAK
jgi:glycosyltransferase involved in cell wall biosynthesis